MLVQARDITRFIPQRDPIVMIGDLVEASDQHSQTSTRISHDNIFCHAGIFTEAGLVENIAQTAAVQVGYQCSQKNTPVPLGYIAAVKDLKIHFLPPVNSIVDTSVKIVNQVMDVTLARGEVKVNGQTCCECEMRIFVKN